MGPDHGHAWPAGQPQSHGGESVSSFRQSTCPEAKCAMACNTLFINVSFSDKWSCDRKYSLDTGSLLFHI